MTVRRTALRFGSFVCVAVRFRPLNRTAPHRTVGQSGLGDFTLDLGDSVSDPGIFAGPRSCFPPEYLAFGESFGDIALEEYRRCYVAICLIHFGGDYREILSVGFDDLLQRVDQVVLQFMIVLSLIDHSFIHLIHHSVSGLCKLLLELCSHIGI